MYADHDAFIRLSPSGDCIYDTFTVTTPGSTAPPVICGYNTKQHMYIPSSELCNNIVIKMDMVYIYVYTYILITPFKHVLYLAGLPVYPGVGH